MEPTDEQVKELWKRCGFQQGTNKKRDFHWEFYRKVSNWHLPSGEVCWESHQYGRLPPIDLNNLSRYAIPKLPKGIRLRMLGQLRGDKGYFCSIGGKLLSHSYKEAEDPALALFWAIYKVIETR